MGNVAEELSEAIRRTYREAGVRQADIATAVGVHQSTVSDWINGHSQPSVTQIIAFDRACGRKPGYIMEKAGLLGAGTVGSDPREPTRPTFKGSAFWKQTLAARQGRDPHRGQREPLRMSYLRLRERIAVLLNEQAKRMPDFTLHDITHVDALWEMADLVCGEEVRLNPAEAYVLGCAFAFHDAAMGLATFPDDKAIVEVTGRFAWEDLVAATFFEAAGRWPSGSEIDEPPDDIYRSCLTRAVRLTHADQAASLVERPWPLGSGTYLYLIEDAHLREAYGPLIGQLAASHWWNVGELAGRFHHAIGAPPWLPTDWTIDPLKLACILRLADAAQLDGRRAPSFLMVLRDPQGASRDHWRFQQHMVRPVFVDDRLSYSTVRPFEKKDAEAWWLALDYLRDVDREFKRVDALLQDLEKPRLAARGIARIDQPEQFAMTFQVSGWRPVDADVQVSDIRSHVAKLGGEQLYGPRPEIAVRELVQNAQDAVLARQAIDFDADGGDVVVLLEQRDDAWFLEVGDNGVGMDEDIIVAALLDFGRSGWRTDTVRSKFVGLAAGGFRPVGTFGIGFYSVFMLGDDVTVTTRHFDTGQADARELRFNGLNTRPLLSRLPRDQQVRRGTTVRVRLKTEPTAPDGLLAKTGDNDLKHLVQRLVPSHKVPIKISDGRTNSDRALPASDLDTATPDEVFDRLYPERETFGMSQTQRVALREEFCAQATEVLDDDGHRLGLATLERRLSSPWPEMRGVVLVDGFRADEHSEFIGYLSGKPTRASRDNVDLACTPEQLRQWFISQEQRLRDRDMFSPSIQLELAEILHQVKGGNLPDNHHIALTAEGPLPVGDIQTWASKRNQVILSYGGRLRWDTRRPALSRRSTDEPATLPDDWLVRCPRSSFPFDDAMFPRQGDPAYAQHQHDQEDTWQKTWWQMSGGIAGLVIKHLCQAWSCQPEDIVAPLAERNWNDYAELDLPGTTAEVPLLRLQPP